MRTSLLLVPFLAFSSIGYSFEQNIKSGTTVCPLSTVYFCSSSGAEEFPYNLNLVVVSSDGTKIKDEVVIRQSFWDGCLFAAKKANESMASVQCK